MYLSNCFITSIVTAIIRKKLFQYNQHNSTKNYACGTQVVNILKNIYH